VVGFETLTNTKFHITILILYLYSPLYSLRATQQCSLEDRASQWLLKFITSLVACFSKTIGQPKGWRGEHKQLAFSIKFCKRASLNCLWVILAPYEVRRRKLFNMFKPSYWKNNFFVHFHVWCYIM
jgi:hypothetical protein